MNEDRNQHQVIRKDARNCFVESLNDAFEIGRIHLAFATLNRGLGLSPTSNRPRPAGTGSGRFSEVWLHFL